MEYWGSKVDDGRILFSDPRVGANTLNITIGYRIECIYTTTVLLHI
jgi:hypothetical protein